MNFVNAQVKLCLAPGPLWRAVARRKGNGGILKGALRQGQIRADKGRLLQAAAGCSRLPGLDAHLAAAGHAAVYVDELQTPCSGAQREAAKLDAKRK